MAQGIGNKLKDRLCNIIIYILHYLLAMYWNEGRITGLNTLLTKLILYEATSGNIILESIKSSKVFYFLVNLLSMVLA